MEVICRQVQRFVHFCLGEDNSGSTSFSSNNRHRFIISCSCFGSKVEDHLDNDEDKEEDGNTQSEGGEQIF